MLVRVLEGNPYSAVAKEFGVGPSAVVRLDCLEQIDRIDPKRRSQAVDVVHRNIPLSALDRTDIGSMQSRTLGQGLLRQAKKLSPGAHIVRDPHSPGAALSRPSVHRRGGCGC